MGFSFLPMLALASSSCAASLPLSSTKILRRWVLESAVGNAKIAQPDFQVRQCSTLTATVYGLPHPLTPLFLPLAGFAVADCALSKVQSQSHGTAICLAHKD